jgi:apolipoprotein D and lipocalin family protein
LPHSFSRRCDGEVTVSYRPKADGTLVVHRDVRTTDGRRLSAYGVAAQPQRADEPAKLKLRFAPNWLGWLPWVWTDYWVIALDDGYRWAMIGEPRRRALRILAREPAMPRDVFDTLKARARRMGYDLAPLVVNRRPASEVHATLQGQPAVDQTTGVA